MRIRIGNERVRQKQAGEGFTAGEVSGTRANGRLQAYTDDQYLEQ